MTKKQDCLYWGEYAAVKRYCTANNLPVPDRHDLHVKALGEDKSHKFFSNEEFDKVLGVFRAISKPTNLNAQLRQLNQEIARVRYNIMSVQLPCLAALERIKRLKENDDQDGLLFFKSGRSPIAMEDYTAAETYITEVMQGKFHTTDISQVSTKQEIRSGGAYEKSDLETLRDTLDARINDLRKSADLTIHDMNMLAGVKCFCRPCVRIRKAQERQAQLTEAV